MEGEGRATIRRSIGRLGSAAKETKACPGQVKQTPGAIGYVELIYAVQNKMPYAEVKNRGGEFVKADARIGHRCAGDGRNSG